MAKRVNVSTDAQVKFWWKDGSIHLRIFAEGIPTQLTTLSAKPGLKRSHPHAFERFAKILRARGKPAPP